MNERVVYLKIDGYTRDWLINRFGNPVKFPARSYENEILARYMVCLPHRCKNAIIDKEGTVAVAVPSIHGKPWESHNHFTVDGRKYLRTAVKNLFQLDMLGTILPNLREGEIYKYIDEFCKSRGISRDSRSAVIKKFYRIRKEYEDNGVMLVCKK